MSPPIDQGVPHPTATTEEAGEWILARVLADAIAHEHNRQALVDVTGILTVKEDGREIPMYRFDHERAGVAAAAALQFFTTTADLFADDDVAEGVPLFALVVSLPKEFDADPPASYSSAGSAPTPPAEPVDAPSKLDLMAAVRRELQVAFPTARRRRAFVRGNTPRGTRLLQQLNVVELQALLTKVETVTDTFRRQRGLSQ